MENSSKNLILAIVLSCIVIYGVRYFFPHQEAEITERQPIEQVAEINQPKSKQVEEKNTIILSTQEALDLNSRASVNNDAVDGSIRIRGSRLDNLFLSRYRQTIDKDSPNVELLRPAKTIAPYYTEFGWTAIDRTIEVPTNDTLWLVKNSKLTPDTPLIFEWKNSQGIKFIRKISVDNDYMFTIEQTVENNSKREIVLYPYGLINKTLQASNSRAGVVHEGFIGVLNSKLVEEKYSTITDDGKLSFETQGGWAGFSDRYWFTSIIFDKQSTSKVNFSNTNDNTFQTDFIGEAYKIAPNSIISNSVMLFAGAKEIRLIDRYARDLGITKFDLAIDFGWYYFLTKPFFYILEFLYNFIGNMGWAIIVFAALLRLVMYPVASKSYESMSKMKKIQPKVQELQEKFKDDKVRLQQETMALYRKEKVNPAAGCLPLVIQIPVFFSLYKVLNIAIEIRHAPFIGWIKDLSAPDPMTISVMTGLPVPSLLDIGLWPIIMGITMYIQQKLNPAPTNKDQARVFAMMPIIFTFMMGHFASGLVIYWTLSNVLSILQQRAIMKKNGV